MAGNNETRTNGAGSNGQLTQNGKASNNGVFPELVIDMGASASRTTGAVPPSPLALKVDNALREVLAWRPRSEDSKGFTAALNQVFTIKEVEGHTEFSWTPRSYAVQADMGAVTGAQASIYSRAKNALDQSVPLLEGLFPLRPDNDREDVEAIRAIVISKFSELVSELGQVGGPRLPRVDDYFESLLGEDIVDNPERVSGRFGAMREEFGLQRQLVNTIDEEQNLTNYLIVVDHVIALRRSWDNLRHFFNHQGSDVFLGTQLVQLSRALGVVAESIDELYFVMDSVFLGAAERQTVRLRNGLTVEELFGWVARFSTEESLSMIRNAGKDGVIAFRPTVQRLFSLVSQALDQSQEESDNPQLGFHHPRTQVAIQEVKSHLSQVKKLTEQLKRGPQVRLLYATPNPADAAKVRVSVEGQNLQQGATIYLNEWGEHKTRIIRGEDVNVVSANEVRASFDLRNLQGTKWAVVVKNPDGESASMGKPLEVKGSVTPPPTTPPPTTPPPTTPPPTTPPPTTQLVVSPLAIEEISLYADKRSVKSMDDLSQQSINALQSQQVNSIHVRFDQAVDFGTVDERTFWIERSDLAAKEMVKMIDVTIENIPDEEIALTLKEGSFPIGDYQVHLEQRISDKDHEEMEHPYYFTMRISPFSLEIARPSAP